MGSHRINQNYSYRKYPHLVRTQVEIIFDPNRLVASSLKDNFQGI